MGIEYEVRQHDYKGSYVYVLAEPGKDDFLEKLESKSKSRDRAKQIVKTAARIAQRGVSECIGKRNFLLPLNSEVALMEMHVPGKVIRAMAHAGLAEEEAILVLLFDFDGHQGSDSIPRHIMNKAVRLAGEAKRALEE